MTHFVELENLERIIPEIPPKCRLVWPIKTKKPTAATAIRKRYEKAWKALVLTVRFANFTTGIYKPSDMIRLKLENASALTTRKCMIRKPLSAMKTKLERALDYGFNLAGVVTRLPRFRSLKLQSLEFATDAAYMLGWDRDNYPGYYDEPKTS